MMLLPDADTTKNYVPFNPACMFADGMEAEE
jgi:hypothetical protein